MQIGEVYQAISNPFDSYKNKVIFQEFGEILLEGVLDLYADASSSYDSLMELEFWERVIIERREYLHMLFQTATKGSKQQYAETIDYVQNNTVGLDAAKFRNLFEEYFEDRQRFQMIYQSLA